MAKKAQVVRYAALLLLASALACRPVDVVLLPPDDAGLPSLAGLIALRVDPEQSPVLTDRGPGQPASFQFAALGTFEDGERDVSDLVMWRLGRDELGNAVSGVVTTMGVGGETFVEARSGSIVATATLQIRLELSIDRTNQQGVLPPVEIDQDLTEGPVPHLIYPPSGVKVPPNLHSIEPQWTHDMATPLHELRIESQFARVRVLTTETSYTFGEGSELDWILRTHRGQSFDMFVRSVDPTTTTVYRSNTVSITVTQSPVEGTGYFWSSDPPSVLRAQISSGQAERRYPADGNSNCTGCHVVSRDGRKMATSSGREGLALVDLENDAARRNLGANKYEGGVFSPNAALFVYADEGRLIIMDVARDQEVDRVPLPVGGFATHPDWSADGRFLVFTYTTHEKPEDYEFEEASIARVDVLNGGGFSELTLLARRQGDETLGYPTISPDGRFVAFTRIQEEHGRGPDTAIEVVDAAGATAPVVLSKLNQRVGENNVDMLRNIVPMWVAIANPGEWWLSFSSRRDYGHRFTSNDRAQIWMSAFDPERAEQALDPSAPAFWLPFQPLGASNYRYQLRNADFDTCGSLFEVCGNSIDDDCNGLIDDGC